jgi:hypothetical protein
VSWVLIAACIGACGPTRLDLTPIGGAWHFYLHSSPIIEAGSRQTDIYREWNGRNVLVASDVEFHEYYEDPDCLLWETSGKDHVVYAACGDRAPIVVATDDYHRWTMEERGLVDEADPRVSAGGAAVTPTVMYSLDQIAAASRRQPAFSAGWRPESVRVDGALKPTALDVRIDVDATNAAGWTPLMVAAAERDSAGVVKSLIADGANVNFADEQGITPLMVAADRSNAEVVELLMDAGADIHARSDDGSTALMKAAGALDNQVEMVTMLLEAGADKTIRNKYGNTALSAIRTNTDPQLKVLLALP